MLKKALCLSLGGSHDKPANSEWRLRDPSRKSALHGALHAWARWVAADGSTAALELAPPWEGAVCPITHDDISELLAGKFGVAAPPCFLPTSVDAAPTDDNRDSSWFNSLALARYFVESGDFTHPISRRAIERRELSAIDAKLRAWATTARRRSSPPSTRRARAARRRRPRRPRGGGSAPPAEADAIRASLYGLVGRRAVFGASRRRRHRSRCRHRRRRRRGASRTTRRARRLQAEENAAARAAASRASRTSAVTGEGGLRVYDDDLIPGSGSGVADVVRERAQRRVGRRAPAAPPAHRSGGVSRAAGRRGGAGSAELGAALEARLGQQQREYNAAAPAAPAAPPPPPPPPTYTLTLDVSLHTTEAELMRLIPTDARADASSRCTLPAAPRRSAARCSPSTTTEQVEARASARGLDDGLAVRVIFDGYHDVVDVGLAGGRRVAAVAGADAADDGLARRR